MEEVAEAPTYEAALQAVGAYLDSQRATEFKLLEAPQGFAVRFEVRGAQAESRAAFFTFRDLHSPGGEFDLPLPMRYGLGSNDRKYRDELAAIGHDLDESRAVSILLDELPDALLITYEYDDPQRGYVRRKRMAVAGPKDRARLKRDARSRRPRLRPRPAVQWQPLMDVGSFR